MKNKDTDKHEHLTEKGFDRLTGFSDDVVSVAMTLLFFPLTELSNAITGNNWWPFLTSHSSQFLATLMSFGVIGLFWYSHHQTFSRMRRADGVVMFWNLLFLLTIVLMPLMDVILTRENQLTSRAILLLYIGNLLLGRVAIALIEEHVRSRPFLLTDHALAHPEPRFAIWFPCLMVLVSLVIALIWPTVGVAAVLLIGLNSVLLRVVRRSRRMVRAEGES